MTDFPNTITQDQAELFLQTCIGGTNASSKFANNKNNSRYGSQTAVTGTALWNYIYQQGSGAGVNGTNYVYGRNAEGNVTDISGTERIFYNPVGTNITNETTTNNVYGAIDGTGAGKIVGVVNHGLYTHDRKITVTNTGISGITAPGQSILTVGAAAANTKLYKSAATDFTTGINLISSLPSASNLTLLNPNPASPGTWTPNSNLMKGVIGTTAYRLDTFSALDNLFKGATGYININNTTGNRLGSASYHLGGMYDLMIQTTPVDGAGAGPFATDFITEGGPNIFANKFSVENQPNSDQQPSDFNANKSYFIPRFVVNKAPLLTSFDINLSVGQKPENGFVDSNVHSAASGVLALDETNFQTATGTDANQSVAVHISPLADTALFARQEGEARATNTPNTVPGEIVSFDLTYDNTVGANATFHAVKIPVTPPGVHLGGMGLRGIVLIARRILQNKGVDVSNLAEYGVYNYVEPGETTDNTKFARLIAGVMNKIGQPNAVDNGTGNAVITDAQSLSAAFAVDRDGIAPGVDFLGIPLSVTTNKRGTTVGRRAYNSTSQPFTGVECFDQYLAAIAGAFLGAGIFLPKATNNPAEAGSWENFFAGIDGTTKGTDAWMNNLSALSTGPGGRGNMSNNLNGDFADPPDEITAAHMGELVRGIYDATCEDIPQYLGANVGSNLAGVQTALKRELTLFKDGPESGATGNKKHIVHISVDDLEYGYSNAKPGMPFFRNSLNAFPGEFGGDPWEQPVIYSGDLSLGFFQNTVPGQFGGQGDLLTRDDMLYDGGLPPPNRCQAVVATLGTPNTIVPTYGVLNTVKEAGAQGTNGKTNLIMNCAPSAGEDSKTTSTGNNFLGYPYQLDYFSSEATDRTKKFGKPKYRWAYYFDNNTEDNSVIPSGGVFL